MEINNRWIIIIINKIRWIYMWTIKWLKIINETKKWRNNGATWVIRIGIKGNLMVIDAFGNRLKR